MNTITDNSNELNKFINNLESAKQVDSNKPKVRVNIRMCGIIIKVNNNNRIDELIELLKSGTKIHSSTAADIRWHARKVSIRQLGIRVSSIGEVGCTDYFLYTYANYKHYDHMTADEFIEKFSMKEDVW